jgi:hypothetical protein
MKNSGGEEEKALSRAAKSTDELYLLRDTYFPQNPHDRISSLQQLSDLILNLLDSVPPGHSLLLSFSFNFSFNQMQIN